MQEQKFKAKEKKVNRMTRSGLVEENLASKGRRKLTDKQEELSFKKSDAEQSFAADPTVAAIRFTAAAAGSARAAGSTTVRAMPRSTSRSPRTIRS